LLRLRHIAAEQFVEKAAKAVVRVAARNELMLLLHRGY